MRPRLLAGLAVLVALAAASPAVTAARYDANSRVTADVPILLAGTVTGLVPQGVVSYLGSDEPLDLELHASRAHLTHYVSHGRETACPVFPIGSCGRPEPETFELADVTFSLKSRMGDAYKLIVLNDAEQAHSTFLTAPGALVLEPSGDGVFGVNPEDRAITPYDDAWTTDPNAFDAHELYGAPAGAGILGVAPGTRTSVAGVGDLGLLLQGWRVNVRGMDASGKPFERDFETFPADRSGVAYLQVEATGASLDVGSEAPFSAFGVTTADATGGARLENAQGTLYSDGARETVNETSLTLEGPLSLTLIDEDATARGGKTARMEVALVSGTRIAQSLPPEMDRDRDAEVATLVAAGAAGAGGAALLGAAAWFWPRLKFVGTALLLPLYTRIEKTSVLDHEKRDEIYELIRQTPGIHAHEIGEKTRIGWGTTVYHLRMLETHSLVVSEKSGRYKRFFVNTGEYTKKKNLYGALRNDTAKAVADFILHHPGASQKELCEAVGIQPSLASWHVEKLEAVGLVKRVKDGRMVRYFAGPAWSDLNVRVLPDGGAEGVAET